LARQRQAERAGESLLNVVVLFTDSVALPVSRGGLAHGDGAAGEGDRQAVRR